MGLFRHGYSQSAVKHNIRVAQVYMNRPHAQAVAQAMAIREAALRRKQMNKRYSADGMDDMPSW